MIKGNYYLGSQGCTYNQYDFGWAVNKEKEEKREQRNTLLFNIAGAIIIFFILLFGSLLIAGPYL